MSNQSDTLYESHIHALDLFHRGKVRDLYHCGHDLLMVACDRISAFDVILPNAIPGKGRILTQTSRFWFEKTRHIVNNHLTELNVETVIGEDHPDLELLRERSMVVKQLKGVPLEAIVRGYLAGSAWKEYQQHGSICGIGLPPNMEQAARLPQPLFTPSTKADGGGHDQNITLEALESEIGAALADKIRHISLELYEFASAYALHRGIIIADSKFEFGLDESGELVLMDELFTPDSSRFWPSDAWQTGISPPSFDKQFVRDYLETLDWDKTAPGPELPEEIVTQTADRYAEAFGRLTLFSDHD
jgi:phosphoribosylaminoimidazole-succinocarboxamide synthase